MNGAAGGLWDTILINIIYANSLDLAVTQSVHMTVTGLGIVLQKFHKWKRGVISFLIEVKSAFRTSYIGI